MNQFRPGQYAILSPYTPYVQYHGASLTDWNAVSGVLFISVSALHRKMRYYIQ